MLAGYTMMAPKEGKAESQKIYYGKTRGIIFTIPDGWIESTPMNQLLEVKFKYSGEMLTQIHYGVEDIVSVLGLPEEQRSSIDSEFFTPEDIKRLIEGTGTLTNAQVELIKTDTVSYFVARNERFRTVAPYEMAVIIEDGYYHSFFLFLSEEESLKQREEEFLSLVSSFSANSQAHYYHLQLSLNSEWQKSGTGYSDGMEKLYIHQSGGMLFQLEVTTERVVGNDMFQQFYNTALWPIVLESSLDSILEAYNCTGETYEVSMNDGVNCYAANAELQGSSVVFSIVQYDNDFWILICSEGENHTASSIFEKVCDAIQVVESSTEGAGVSIKQGQSKYNDGYYISEIPVIVHLNDKELNIYTQNTPEDSLTMQRTAKDKATMDWYVKAQNAKIIITYPDLTPPEFKIEIRVKDEKYNGVPSWDQISESELSAMMDMIYGDQISPYDVYKTETATFTVFKMYFDTDAIRYVTIKNGDIIYVHMKRGNGALTDADYSLIKTVVDSMEFLSK